MNRTPRAAFNLLLAVSILGGATFLAGIPHPLFDVLAPPASAADRYPSQGGLYDTRTGYRLKHYRAATPDDVPGGRRVDMATVDELLESGDAILLDVMPSTGASYSPKTGKWRLAKRHDHIPGSVWLPDVGLGRIPLTLERYLAGNLHSITGGDKSRTLIVYCQSDCWMAWNAVQRIADLGYEDIAWYPDGIDGWRDFDRKLVPAEPTPIDPRYLEGARP